MNIIIMLLERCTFSLSKTKQKCNSVLYHVLPLSLHKIPPPANNSASYSSLFLAFYSSTQSRKIPEYNWKTRLIDCDN